MHENNEIIMNKKLSDFKSQMNPKASYVLFRHDEKGDGTKFIVQILHPTGSNIPSSYIELPSTCLEAFLYSLGELKQNLELQKIRNG